jgi:hypothetical protein
MVSSKSFLTSLAQQRRIVINVYPSTMDIFIENKVVPTIHPLAIVAPLLVPIGTIKLRTTYSITQPDATCE